MKKNVTSKKKNVTAKERALQLYLERNEDATKKNSSDDIIVVLLNEGYKKVTRQTIWRWSKTPDKLTKNTWDDLVSKIKQQSIVKANNDRFTSEEKIVDSKSDDLAETYIKAKQCSDVGFNIIFKAYKGEEHSLISLRDAITLAKVGTDITFRVNEGPEDNKDNVIIVKGL
jgi:hypothetical protein